MKWKDLIGNKKNIVFVGESGCGKTELALNCAVRLAAESCMSKQEITLIDMDQTKGVYRARDFRDIMESRNVSLVCGEHFLDTPVVPPGVIRLLTEDGHVNVLDVGGNETGALTMGQFSEYIRQTASVIVFVINPFRIFSLDEAHIALMAERIKAYGDFDRFIFAVNPNMGEYTDMEMAAEGIKTAADLAEKLGVEISAITLADWLRHDKYGDKVIYIKRYLQYP